jgi:hypothetical protein
MQAAYGEAGSPGTSVPEDGPSVADDSPSLLDGVQPGEAQPSETHEKTPAPKGKPGDVEEVVVTDEFGRRRVKVDYTDRDKVKRAYQMAAGFGKMKADRDGAQAWRKQVEPELSDLRTSWKAVEEAFQRDGIRGLADLLGGEGAGQKFEEDVYQRRRTREEASPAQLKQLEMEEALAKERKERERLSKTVEAQLKEAQDRKDAADTRMLQTRIEPVFERHRFAGKLGDTEAEAELDESMWNKVIARLQAYPDDVELTPGLISKEFAAVAQTFHRIIRKQADTETQRTIAAKKQAAQESAATAASSGLATNAEAESFRKNIKSGRIVDAFQQLMTGKVRL